MHYRLVITLVSVFGPLPFTSVCVCHCLGYVVCQSCGHCVVYINTSLNCVFVPQPGLWLKEHYYYTKKDLCFCIHLYYLCLKAIPRIQWDHLGKRMGLWSPSLCFPEWNIEPPEDYDGASDHCCFFQAYCFHFIRAWWNLGLWILSGWDVWFIGSQHQHARS